MISIPATGSASSVRRSGHLFVVFLYVRETVMAYFSLMVVVVFLTLTGVARRGVLRGFQGMIEVPDQVPRAVEAFARAVEMAAKMPMCLSDTPAGWPRGSANPTLTNTGVNRCPGSSCIDKY
jgi:hypothetical protein